MAQRLRRSIIWQILRDELAGLVAGSQTFSQVLRHFGLNHQGGNCRTLKSRLHEDGIDCSHIREGRDANRGRRMGGSEMTLDVILVEHSDYKSRGRLKRRLLRAGLVANQCAICGCAPSWNGRPLTLVLDHINGVSGDNRLENLRLLCPNCNSQTATFCGRNAGIRSGSTTGGNRHLHRTCALCGAGIADACVSGRCAKCQGLSRRKVTRPSQEELRGLVESQGYSATGRMCGVSDNCIRKWLTNPDGPWSSGKTPGFGPGDPRFDP